ncbi:MAG: DUF2244 domain-containing protein [Paracoccaceae bacterium]
MTTGNSEAAGAHAPAARPSSDRTDRTDPPVWHVTLWPNRSLSPAGKRQVMAIAAAGFALPLIGSIGTPVFWGILPFEAAALGCLWYGFRRSDFDGTLTEELTLWSDEIRVERREPSGRIQRWSANPYWVTLQMHEDATPENYLTLSGAGRKIELGAFLSPEERAALHDQLAEALARAR